MKRDMDLIRLLLLDVEGEDRPDLSAYTTEQRVYHLALLIEADLMAGGVLRDSHGFPVQADPIRLTWDGHEFLDAARNETIWRKAFEKVKKGGSTVSIAILTKLLATAAKEYFGIE